MKKRPKTKEKKRNNLTSSALFNYWKNAHLLQNSFNEHSDIENLQNIAISLDSLLYGKLNQKELEDYTKHFKSLVNNSEKDKAKQFLIDNEGEDLIGVLFSPCQLKSVNSSLIHDLFLIPAKIDRKGILYPYSLKVPWIPRMYLEPNYDDNLPIISDIDLSRKTFEYFSNHEFKKFTDYFKTALNCFKEATGFDFNKIEIEGYRTTGIIALKIAPKKIPNDSITKLFELLDKGKIAAGSIQSFVKNRPTKIYYKYNKTKLYQTSKQHVAHFNNEFELALSQRSSLYKFLQLGENIVLPIDGPPGTGKTTLIQAIVANTFVESALSRRGSPPIIVVCGATNQSVTNVIDSLNERNNDDPLAARWIPNLKSYGLFCASKIQATLNSKYHIENRQNTGFYFEQLNTSDIYEIENFYLQKFNSVFKKNTKSVESATKEIRRKLLEVNNALLKSTNDILKYNLLEKTFPIFSALDFREYETTIQKLAQLDTSIRYRTFQLATHYWEGMWISSFLKMKQLVVNKRHPSLNLLEWRWRAMLTPCFVSTLQMAGKYFSIKHNPTPTIDLLIFDEAGQILPEDGVALCGLARKVVTIGDTNQLKPYSTTPITLDSLEIRRHKLDRKLNSDFDGLSELGITSSAGSFMRLSKSYFKYRDEYGSGGSLNEHRRSVPKIVDFCNRLSYYGRLIPKREAIAQPLMDTFSYVNIRGKSIKKGSSRYNSLEAEEINKWLGINSKKIVANYSNSNLHELVAVITPFTAQVSVIKSKLDRKFSSLTVGTINSLQGSEKPIILFSAVYDDSDERRFMLNNDKLLLNVGVSRAKDYFVFFGNLEMLSKGHDNPSNLLYEFLCSSD